MKYLLILFFSIISILASGQQNNFKIGFKDYGLFFGNPKKSNGLRLNFSDKNVERDNGLVISGIKSAKKSNGINIGILLCKDSISNGINLGLLMNASRKINGLSLGGLGMEASKVNGFSFSGLMMDVDTFNGIFISLIGLPHFMDVLKSELKSKVNGVAIGGIYGVDSDELNGLAIGCFNYSNKLCGAMIGLKNSTKELHGFEFGLWNIAENNRFFKRTPIINFNFK